MIIFLAIIQISTASPSAFHLATGIGYTNQSEETKASGFLFSKPILWSIKPALPNGSPPDITLDYRPLTENKNMFMRLLGTQPSRERWQNVLSVRDAIFFDTTRQGGNATFQNNGNYIQ